MNIFDNKTLKTFLILSGLFVVITLFYSNHFSNEFHFDDNHVIVENPYVKDLSKAPQYFKDASTFSTLPQNQSYRPLLTLLFAIDYQKAHGLNPFWFHVDSFFWFLLTVLCIYLLSKNLFSRSHPKYTQLLTAAFFGAAWFGLHTVNGETVNYLSARSDIFSGFAVVSSLVLWIYLPKMRKFGIFLIPFIAGILAKEQTITFLPIFMVYYWLFERNKSLGEFFSFKHKTDHFKLIKASIVILIITIIGGILVLKMAGSSFSVGGTSRGLYILTQCWVICRYLIAFFIPVNLSADSDWQLLTNPFDERIIIGILIVSLLVFIAFKTSKDQKMRPITFGILWFIFALLPTSLVPLAEVTNDHRMFFPFIGLAIAAVWALSLVTERFLKNKIAVTLIIISMSSILLLNGIGVYERNKVWKSEETLWLDVTIKSPKNGRGLMNYGLTQMRIGNLEKALLYYQKALEFTPNYPHLYINIAICKNALGYPQEAEQSFKRAIELGLTLYEPYYFYADYLYKHNRKSESLKNVEYALTINPWYMSSRYLAMNIYNDLSQWGKLESMALETIQKFPNDTTAKNLFGLSQKKESRTDYYKRIAKTNPTPENYLTLSLECYNNSDYYGCIDACNQALKLKPDYADAYNNICSAYNSLGEYKKAIEAGEKAIAIKPDYQLAKNNLAYSKSKLK